MAKKITFTLLVLLIVSAFVFVSCNAEAGEGGGGVKPAPAAQGEVKNKAGKAGTTNLVTGGTGDDVATKDDSMVAGDDVSVDLLEGIGVDGTKGYKISQNGKWGQIIFDMTRFYGRGKSYLIKATVKLVAEETTNTDTHFGFSFDVVSGAVMEAVDTHPLWDPEWEDYYDCDDVYGYDLLTDTEAEEIFDLATTPVQAANAMSSTQFLTFSAIIPAEEIEACLKATTEKYGSATDTPTLALMHMGILVGSGDNGGTQAGYTYILDNLEVFDLNTELPRTGATYKPKTDEGDALE